LLFVHHLTSGLLTFYETITIAIADKAMNDPNLPDNTRHRLADSESAALHDPLTECLLYLGKLYHLPVSRTGLLAGLPLADNRLSVELFSRAADRAGMVARLVKRPLRQMNNLELPTVLLLADGQACVLTDIDQSDQRATVILPQTGLGETRLDHTELDQQYTGYSLFVRPKFRQDRQRKDQVRSDEKNWFWGTLFSSWRIYRDVLLASLLINTFGLAGPFFTMNVYDRVIPPSGSWRSGSGSSTAST